MHEDTIIYIIVQRFAYFHTDWKVVSHFPLVIWPRFKSHVIWRMWTCHLYWIYIKGFCKWWTNTPVAGWRFDGIAMFASSVSCKETTGGWYHRSSSTRCFAILSRRIVSRICLGWFTSTVSHALWKILLMSKTCPAAFSKYSFWPKFIAQPSKRVFLYTLIQDLWWT